MRRSIRRQAEEKAAAKNKELMLKVFAAFRSVCVGKLSRKKANQNRADMIEAIRNELSQKLVAKGKLGVVPMDEITTILNRRILLQFLAAKRLLCMQNILRNCFAKVIVMRNRYARNAKEHWFVKCAGKCFYAWSDYTYMVSVGLERKRWPGPRKYEVGVVL